ncbi:MAG TPA: S9 family peptidase [Thermomicrobiaceae bacterium]|nr:S9 family peptidase [Thermomicrobiaceae bacterium]
MGKTYPGAWDARLAPRRFARLTLVGGPRLSPDGGRVAYIADVNGRADIYVVDRQGGAPAQVTAEHAAPGISGLYGAATGMDWAADGDAIVYTSPDDGHLYWSAVDGSASTLLTDAAGSQSQPSCSSAGVVFVNARPDKDQVDVAVAPADGSDWSRRVGDPTRFHAMPRWSPDGRRIVAMSYDKAKFLLYESSLVVIDAVTGTSREVAGGENVGNRDPRWSPDGRRIAFISDRSGWANLWLADVESGRLDHLVDESREHGEPCWSPDGARLAYLRNDDGDVQIHILDLGSGQIRPLTGEAGTHGALNWTPDGREIVCAFQSPVRAPRIVAVDVETGGQRDIVAPQLGGIEDAGLVMPESIHYESVDGLSIHALLYRPADARPGEHPLLVHIHGGPQGQYGFRWDVSVQYFLQRGWAVVEPNFRGSTGYGRPFLDALNDTWGDLDLEDNVASIAAVDALGLIDRGRSVAWGGSGGGYATMVCLTRKPDVFKAGVALFGLSNLVAFGEQTDRLARDLVPWVLGPSRENYRTWVERSPITHVDAVQAPMLVLQGDADWRVPPAQSEELVQALEKQGKTVEYQKYAGEGHGWRKADTIVDYIERMDRFLTRYVVER